MAKKIKLQLWLLAAGFAALLTISFLVPHAGFLALVAFIPLFQMDALLDRHQVKYAWWYYFSAFLLFNIGSTFWIWWVSEVGAVATIVLNSLQMAAIFAIYRWSKKRLGRWAVLFFIVMWLAWEHVYFEIELSWPWLVLGNAFATSTRLVQWYDTLGSLGGSLWILATGALLFNLLTCRGKAKAKVLAAVSAFVIVAPIGWSEVKYATFQESDDPIEVVAIQPNVDPFAKYGILPQENLDKELLALADKVVTEKTDYVITPETFTYDINIDDISTNASCQRYQEWLKNHPGTQMILGALSWRLYNSSLKPTPSARPAGGGGWYDSFNTAMVIDSSLENSHYFKSKLVPGVEIIPYMNTFGFLGKIVSACGGSSSSYGTQKEMDAISLDGKHYAGVMICYESIYGDWSRNATRKGADFLAVITNDGWWGDTPGYRQHFRFAKLRAIENRRDLVHVANTGTSGVINQRGDVLLTTPWWTPTSFNATLNCNKKITPFAKRGDLIGLSCCWIFIAFAAMLVFLCVSGKRFACDASA